MMRFLLHNAGTVLFLSGGLLAQSVNQPVFPTPEAAVKALVKAMQDGKPESTLSILGPELKSALEAADQNLLKLERELFLVAARRSIKIERDTSDQNRAIAHFGEQDWPFPVPLVKRGQSWQFDGKEGAMEISDRAIGRHELAAIAVCNGYVEAQLEYSSVDWDNDGILEFAQKLNSTRGAKDGLYWSSDDGGAPSPLGPFLAGAVVNEGEPQPLAGYYYKILTKQGPDARGGARDYVLDGNQLLGFALVAWPAQYGNSGVSTFIVNQLGDVYEKDLGEGTAAAAKAIEQFNPDSSWKKVDQD